MRTVTICGSMKFETEMQRIAFLFQTKYNRNVLQCVYNVDGVDIQGYIGKQVSKEIAFAKSKGKEVIFHSAYGKN